MLGKIEGKRRGRQRRRWSDSIIDSMNISVSKLLEIVKDRGAWHVAVQGVPESRTRLSDCMTTATQEKRRPSLEHACCPNYLPVINSILPSVRSPWPVRRCLPAALSVPTLSLLFVLNKLTPFCNPLGLEILFQLHKFQPGNPWSDYTLAHCHRLHWK